MLEGQARAQPCCPAPRPRVVQSSDPPAHPLSPALAGLTQNLQLLLLAAVPGCVDALTGICPLLHRLGLSQVQQPPDRQHLFQSGPLRRQRLAWGSEKRSWSKDLSFYKEQWSSQSLAPPPGAPIYDTSSRKLSQSPGNPLSMPCPIPPEVRPNPSQQPPAHSLLLWGPFPHCVLSG